MPLENLDDLEAAWAEWLVEKVNNKYTQGGAWRRDNPGEWSKLKAYYDGTGPRPTLVSQTGKTWVEIVDAIIEARDVVPPPPPPTDTQPPVVTLTSPGNGSTVSGTINVTATATDNVGVTRVEFFRDGVLIGTDTSSPYSVSFDTNSLADGSHTFGARALDAAGNVGFASQATVTVANGSPPPGGTAPWLGSFDASYQAAPLGSTITVPAGTYPAQTINYRAGVANQSGTSYIKFVTGGQVTINGGLQIRGSRVWIDGGNRLKANGRIWVQADSATQHPDHVIVEGTSSPTFGIFNADDITFRNMDVGPATCWWNGSYAQCCREGPGDENKVGAADGIIYTPKRIVLDGLKIHNQNADSTRLQPGADVHFGGLFIITVDGLTVRNCVFERNVVYHVQIQNFGQGNVVPKNVLFEKNSFGAPVEWLDRGDIPCGQHAIQLNTESPGATITIRDNVCANGPGGLFECYVNCDRSGVVLQNNTDLTRSVVAPPLP